ncbi:hypothetical protein DY000_02020090 [Brassica cretica]|uniref:Uncharacterized protein n=1 Tax=Brassica cretica TaxID=69181 RepID=A0ABQ7EC71_BRACR|nr:hypothetical protein DY000_02020090 [Brassica cretica]
MVKETTHEGSQVLNRSGSRGSSTGGEVVMFWSKECISHGGEEHGDGRPEVDGAYLMGEKSMVWCTSRGGEKHNKRRSFQKENVVVEPEEYCA